MIQFLTLMIQAQKSKMDARGASAVEYGLLVAGIAAVIVAVIFFLGDDVLGGFNTVEDRIGGNQG